MSASLTNRTCLGSAAVILSLLAIAGAAAAAELKSLGWMSGSWGGTRNGIRTEEHWTTAEGGLMVCMHRDLREGRALSFEFLRVEQRGDSLVFVALPRGRNETSFPMRVLERRRVVFENPDHDFPQRVSYWQDRPGTLRARVEGTIGGRLESEEWTWTRVSLDRPSSASKTGTPGGGGSAGRNPR